MICVVTYTSDNIHNYINEEATQHYTDCMKLLISVFIAYLINVSLTVVHEMHSHLEPMWELNPDNYQNRVSC